LKSLLIAGFCTTKWLNIGVHVHLTEVSAECRLILQKQLPRKVEVGCLRHPGASSIGSQLLDGPLPWLANLGNPGPHAKPEDLQAGLALLGEKGGSWPGKLH